MLEQLVYTSSAAVPFTPEELAEIARLSRVNNAAVGVTGAILYHDGNVMQVLEGPPEAVSDTFRRISRDSRHRGILPIYRSPIEERTFEDWAMGLVRPDQIPLDDRESVRTLFDVTESGTGRAQKLLRTFQAIACR